MTKNEELKACPFCKSSDLHIQQELQHKTVTCISCGASAGLNIWNTRPTVTPADGDAESEAKAIDAIDGVLVDHIDCDCNYSRYAVAKDIIKSLKELK